MEQEAKTGLSLYVFKCCVLIIRVPTEIAYSRKSLKLHLKNAQGFILRTLSWKTKRANHLATLLPKIMHVCEGSHLL